MTHPEFEPILREAIARTGINHYRYLCLEHPDPKIRAGYQGIVIDIAFGTSTGQRYDPIAEPPAGPCGCDGSPYPE